MKKKTFLAIILVTLLAVSLTFLSISATFANQPNGEPPRNEKVTVEVFAPGSGDVAGILNKAFLVDLAVDFKNYDLAQTGFTAPELSGPGAHNNVAPFPGVFAAGSNAKFPGLIVLLSTTTLGAGQGQNLAGLFNIVTVTDRSTLGKVPATELWATWIVGAASFGTGDSHLLVAIAADKNGNGVFDDAPNVVPDTNGDGKIDAADLVAFGVASNIAEVDFVINPNP
jgi:hypothetical protein